MSPLGTWIAICAVLIALYVALAWLVGPEWLLVGLSLCVAGAAVLLHAAFHPRR